MIIDFSTAAVGCGHRDHIAEGIVGVTGFTADFIALNGNAAVIVALGLAVVAVGIDVVNLFVIFIEAVKLFSAQRIDHTGIAVVIVKRPFFAQIGVAFDDFTV